MLCFRSSKPETLGRRQPKISGFDKKALKEQR
jgi:hypothetical protein